MRSRLSRHNTLCQVTMLLVGIIVAACAKPPQVLADTPSGNPLAPRLRGDTQALPGLGAPAASGGRPGPGDFRARH
jgi:hypothetical protein